jgi:prepilin-type N-terminal cleavage/methylation domain-containing protein
MIFQEGRVDPRRSFGGDAGMTMIEIAVVIALIAFLYTIAVPQFSLRTGTEAANKVQRVADDIRAAFDLAVLNNKTYRMSFVMATGEYWLEESDRPVEILGDGNGGKDPTEEEEKLRSEQFDELTKEYQSVAGDPVLDEDGQAIPGSNESPILKNRTAAKGPQWRRVEALEWQDKTVGPNLLISEMQAEHHQQKQVLADVGETGRALIYFFPSGYVEKAFITIAFKSDPMVVDEAQKPYTVITRPFLGKAEVNSGTAEIDVHDLGDESGQS